jgi:hypothetical protein
LRSGEAASNCLSVGLRAHLLQLLAPFHAGEEVVPGARLAGVLLEIGSDGASTPSSATSTWKWRSPTTPTASPRVRHGSR